MYYLIIQIKFYVNYVNRQYFQIKNNLINAMIY